MAFKQGYVAALAFLLDGRMESAVAESLGVQDEVEEPEQYMATEPTDG